MSFVYLLFGKGSEPIRGDGDSSTVNKPLGRCQVLGIG